MERVVVCTSALGNQRFDVRTAIGSLSGLEAKGFVISWMIAADQHSALALESETRLRDAKAGSKVATLGEISLTVVPAQQTSHSAVVLNGLALDELSRYVMFPDATGANSGMTPDAMEAIGRTLVAIQNDPELKWGATSGMATSRFSGLYDKQAHRVAEQCGAVVVRTNTFNLLGGLTTHPLVRALAKLSCAFPRSLDGVVPLTVEVIGV